MNNAEKFKQIFGIYATELWAMSEEEFIKWINSNFNCDVCVVSNEDTISRHDAIRIVDGIDTWQAGWRGNAIESMKALPSAQPVAKDTNVLSKDTIDRQAAIDALTGIEFCHCMEFGKYIGENTREVRWIRAEKAQDALQNLPPVQPFDKDINVPTTDTISRHTVIDTEGLDAQIRCEMCRNPMHTYRGCDGNCKYDEKLYERIMQILGERIKPLPSAQPEGWMEQNKDRILKAGMEGREVEFRIGGRLFAIREKAQ